MNPDTQRGMAFMKVVVKSSLFALFTIGVKSPDNIEKFVAAFEKAMDRGLSAGGFIPHPMNAQPMETDITFVVKSNLIRSVLQKHGILTGEALVEKLKTMDLTTLKGIGTRSVAVIRKDIDTWQSSLHS